LNAEKFSGKNVAKEVVEYAIKLADGNTIKDSEYQMKFSDGLRIENDIDEGLPHGHYPVEENNEDVQEYKKIISAKSNEVPKTTSKYPLFNAVMKQYK
jgi:hypothetical protein